jgi:hypothetical protein
MEYIGAIQSSVGDAFLTLPLLIMGFSFFLGTLTSNIGLLYLFLGHLLLVPSLSFLANEPGPAWFEGKTVSIVKGVKWLFSMLLFLNIHGSALGGGAAYSLNTLLLLPLLGQFITHSFGKDVPVLWFFNPVAWFMKPNPTDTKAGTCSIVPGTDSKDSIYTSPSSWLVHILFFFGFLFNNALAVYSQPTPKLSGAVDEATRQDRENRLTLRVRNRKWLAASIMAVILFAASILIFFRYARTPCESGFLYSLIPSVIIALTGASWFQSVYKNCGVRPADVLGIVQGMISPDLIDNPIVCVGS